ncbi:MAG: low molecular weight protein arginine phosphatase [Candidatus Krumholzibacteriia bacterium]
MTRPTVTFVCTGNTCRSPLAMALARRLWPDTVQVESAGLRALPGEPAAAAAQTVAREHRADLSGHRSRRLQAGDLERPGWIIGMTRAHVAMLARHLDPTGPVRLGLLGAPGEDLRGRPTPVAEEVNDPFGGDVERYRATAEQLARLLALWTCHVGDLELEDGS